MKRHHSPSLILSTFQRLTTQTPSLGTPYYQNLSLAHKPQFFSQPETETEILFKFESKPQFCNLLGTLHGGALATLLDLTTGVALTCNDREMRKSVSLQLNLNFIRPARKDEGVLIWCVSDRVGRRFGNASCEVYDLGLNLLCNGTHVKVFVDERLDG